MFMKKIILFLLPVIGIIGLSFLSKDNAISTYHADGIEGLQFSSNPPAARTGAPGEGNCTSCHSGTTMSAEGVAFFTVGGGPGYTPGATYPISFSTVGGANNGFQLTILDASNNAAGTFTAGANNNVTTSGGRSYVRHNNSVGEGSWTFDWTAPATDVGELTAYYALNKANNNGSDSGDEIFLGNTAIPPFGVSIQENELEKGFNVIVNAAEQRIQLNYTLTDLAKVVLNVQDLNGRLVQSFDYGKQMPGSYQEDVQISTSKLSGLYVVSLFVDNHVMNRKVQF